jgi:hypothetical protein
MKHSKKPLANALNGRGEAGRVGETVRVISPTITMNPSCVPNVF